MMDMALGFLAGWLACEVYVISKYRLISKD